MLASFKHVRNYLVGGVAVKALGIVSMPFFTNALTIEEFGVMSLYTVLLSFFSTFLSLGILGSFKRYYFEGMSDYGSFLLSNISLLIVLDAFFIGLYFYNVEFISKLVGIPISVLNIVVFSAFLLNFIKIYANLLQVQGDSFFESGLEFFRAFLMLFFSVLVVLYLENQRYLGKVYGEFLAFLIVACYVLYKLHSILKLNFNLEHVKYSLLFGLPVLPSMFSSFGLGFADRFMINSFIDAEAVGLYSVAYTIAMLLQMVVFAISKSWQPMFYKTLSEGGVSDLKQPLTMNSKIVFSFSFLLIIFSNELILLLTNKEYLMVVDIVWITVIGFNFFFLYTVYGQYTGYLKKTYLNSLFTMLAVSVNILLNYIFIPLYGLWAAAISTLISYFFLFCFFYYYAKVFMPNKFFGLSIIGRVCVVYTVFLLLFLLLECCVELEYIYSFIVKVVLFVSIFIVYFKVYIANLLRERVGGV